MWRTIVVMAVLGVTVSSTAGPQLWRLAVPGHHRVVRSLADEGDIDVWGHTHSHTEVLVGDDTMARVARALDEAAIEHSVEVEDVMALVREERRHMNDNKRKKRDTTGQMDWTTYHDLEDIRGLEDWLTNFTGGLVRKMSVATTDEGREVRVLRIANNNSPGPKKKIWIEGGIHAREWISPAVTTYLMHQVATNPAWAEILNVTEWYFVPVANPDGYKYSFSDEPGARLWRKNRRVNGAGRRCMGVDLNRNWNLKWGVGASSNPCSETYKGVQAFSEPETAGLQHMMKGVGDIDLFITFHSYGQTVLYPWGWTRNPPANVRQLNRVARKFADTVKSASRQETKYNFGGSGPLYGLASGASDDWAYGALQVPFSYTIELPDTGARGFLLPENRVSGTVIETATGIHCMVGFLTNVGSCARRRTNHPNSPNDPNSNNHPNFLRFWG